ncbi:g5375 [Coccomyxa viridis]|uniref:G5375 protein n=1 Tax=Coccomyxa viridis TaxID=1274662 RepID=A0ABP1FSN7_9CHLO
MHFLPKEWIMECWEDGFYITAMAGSAGGSSLVVTSKGTPYAQQSYKVSDSFPFKCINKKWDAGGFRITACAATPDQAAFVLSVPRRRPMEETQETLRMLAFQVAV